MVIISPYNYDPSVSLAEESVEWPPSQTEPDNTLSISEILTRYTRGLNVDVTSYDGQDDGISDDIDDFGDDVVNLMIDYDKLDLTEIDDIRRNLNQRANEIRKSMRSAENSVVTSDAPSLGQGGSESKTEEQAAQPENTV